MINTVNIAYYEKKDWGYFLSIIEDKESMHELWEDWFMAYTKVKIDLKSQGFIVKEIVVNINELVDYCIDNKIKNDGKTRSMFVQNKK